MRARTISNRQMWRLWQAIRQRCYNPNNKDYARYGGRGIFMSDAWKDNFNQFFADVGIKPAGMKLERIDNNKGYSKENCKWATATEQSNNRKGNVTVTFNGLTMTYGQWDTFLGFSHGTVRSRIVGCGWPLERALVK